MEQHTIQIIAGSAREAGEFEDALSRQPEMAVVANISDGIAGYAMASVMAPTVTVISLHTSGINGLFLGHLLSQRFRAKRILMVTPSPDPAIAYAALDLGSHGVWTGSREEKGLVFALRELLSGRGFLSQDLFEGVHALERSRTASPQRQLLETFTRREREVLALSAAGLTARETADVVSISPRTVEGHRRGIKRKLGVRRMQEVLPVMAQFDLMPMPRNASIG